MASRLTSKEIWSLKRTVARVIIRADKNQKDKRKLQIEVRYLERGRDPWKQKYLHLENASRMSAFFVDGQIYKRPWWKEAPGTDPLRIRISSGIMGGIKG